MNHESLPFISCIMPTRNRGDFLPQALRYFAAQDYPYRELIIVDDSPVPAPELAEHVAGVRYVHISQQLPIGMKRDIAVALAEGEIIAFFDDDDYYGPARLTRQVQPILDGEAGCSAMRMSLLLDVAEGTLWTCDDALHRQLFKQDVHYGTLMFCAAYWHRGTHFPPVFVGEDRRFVHALLSQDVALARVVDSASFAYVLHGNNTTSDMRRVYPDGWSQVELGQYFSLETQAFYAALRERRRAQPCAEGTSAPIKERTS